MSLDALRLVCEYMSPAGRIHLAQISTRICNDLTRWEDVHSLLFGDTKVLMAGEVFSHRIDSGRDLDFRHTLDKSFALCPHTRHVWIQTRLRQEHIEELNKHSNTIEELYISSENFDTQYPVTWDGFSPNRLRRLHILQRMDQPLNMRQVLDSTSCEALFPTTLRHIVLTGIVLSRPLMDTILSLTNLRHFDAIGCLIDTSLAAEYVEKLAQLPNLNEMSMPPSMFSFSTREENGIKFSMRKLRLSRLSLFMEQFDESTFFEQLETIMPRKLETLILYGNYFPLKKSKKYGQWRKFEIVFGSMTLQVKTQWWMREECLLISHLVRNFPYRISEDFRPIRNTAGSWRFNQAVIDNDNARQDRLNLPQNRTLRFIRPEGAPAPILAPRGVAEALPPPPPPPRRERLRTRSVPTVTEERNAAPNSALPNVGAPAPVAIVVPIAPPQAASPTSNTPITLISTSLLATPPPAPVANTQLTEPVVQSQFNGRLPADGNALAAAQRPVENPISAPETNLAISAPMQDRGYNESISQNTQSGHIDENSADTPTQHDQLQAPGELPLVTAQPTSPQGAQTASTPQHFVASTETNANSADHQGVAPVNFGAQSGREAGHEGHHEHADENINMILQGMIQALVEEIVFDAANEERRENLATDPSPAVSSNISNTDRSSTAVGSARHTPQIPTTPPQLSSAQVPREENSRNRQH